MSFNFNDWLNTPGLFRTILVEINYNLLGAPKTLYVSNASYISHGSDSPAYQPYDAFITNEISFNRQLSEIFNGNSRYELSQIELLSFENVPELLTASTTNHQIKILIGDRNEPLANFKLIVDALIADVLPSDSDNKVVVKLKDKAKSLETDHVTPMCFGRCFNITPVLIDAANHIYQFNSVASQALNAARFNGALVDANNYTIDLSASTITFLIQPQGVVTLDVDGAKIDGTWLQSATDIIEYLIPSATVLNLPAYLLGLYIDSSRTISAIIDEVCASVGGYWFYDRLGMFICKHFNGTSGVYDHELTNEQNIADTRNPQRKLTPVHQISMQFQRNFTPLSNVAAVVFDTDLALAEQLQEDARVAEQNNATTLTNYPESLTLTDIPSLIVNFADVATEITRRLALRNKPRFVYQTQQLSGALQFQLGDELLLERAGLNGDEAIITKLDEGISSGKTTVGFWQ